MVTLNLLLYMAVLRYGRCLDSHSQLLPVAMGHLSGLDIKVPDIMALLTVFTRHPTLQRPGARFTEEITLERHCDLCDCDCDCTATA